MHVIVHLIKNVVFINDTAIFVYKLKREIHYGQNVHEPPIPMDIGKTPGLASRHTARPLSGKS